MPMLGVTRLIFDREVGSARGDEDFFSVARTMPLVALGESQYDYSCSRIGKGEGDNLPLIPSAVTPWLTALSAYSDVAVSQTCLARDGVTSSILRSREGTVREYKPHRFVQACHYVEC